MGTSSSYGGHKDSSPLLPPDYDGDDAVPDQDGAQPKVPDQPTPQKKHRGEMLKRLPLIT